MKKKCLACLMFFMFPFVSLAYDECTTEQYSRLQKLASNVSYVVEEYVTEYGLTRFKVTFTGTTEETVITEEGQLADYFYVDTMAMGDTIVEGIWPGRTLVFQVLGDKLCTDNVLRSFTIVFPEYNTYYDNPLCVNNRNHKYCQKWGKINVSYETFQKAFQEEKKTQEKITIQPGKYEVKRTFYYYFRKYYWWILGSMIIIFIILTYLWIKENKKNKL